MKKALIVLALEVAVLAVAVVAYLAADGPGVQMPASADSAASSSKPAKSARGSVPVSIQLHGVCRVETAGLARGGKAVAVGAPAEATDAVTTTAKATVAVKGRSRP